MRLPKYRLHKPSGRAVIEFRPLYGHRRLYLKGPHNSPESLADYERRCQEIVAFKCGGSDAPPLPRGKMTVSTLLEAYFAWAKDYYPKRNDKRGEFHNLMQAAGPLRRVHGETEIQNFGPLALKEVRQRMIVKGWCRQHVNSQIKRVRRIFGWAVENELLRGDRLVELRAVSPLAKGKTKARESDSVTGVEWEHIAAVLPHLPPMLQAIVQCQWYLGVRSDEITSFRLCETDTKNGCLVYVPKKHKTEWRGKLKFVVFGPRSLELIRPYMNVPEDRYVFSPRIAQAERAAKKRAERKTKVYGNKPRRERSTRPRYSADSYQHAVQHAFEMLVKSRGHEKQTPSGKRWKPDGISWRKWLKQYGITYWHPHQLRHARATLTRERYKREGVEAQLGNVKQAIDIYALPSFPLAVQIAQETG